MINLLYCGNDKVYDGVLTSLLSILKRDPSLDEYTVYVFTMNLTRLNDAYTPISEERIASLDRLVKKYNPASKVIKVDVTDLYESQLGHSPNEGCYCSPYTLLRLFADEIDSIQGNLLYLDADIMFNRDIHLLTGHSLEGYELAGAPDHYGKYFFLHPYINAGVLYFNMDECRKRKTFEKARAWINRKKLIFADQSAIARSAKRKKVLRQRYNDQKFLHKHTVVRHFSKRLFWLPYPHTDNIKQWHIDKVHAVFKYHAFDDIYEEYIQWKKDDLGE